MIPRFDTQTPAARFTASLASRSVDETIALGRRIGTVLKSGDVTALVGRLGAGKTHFAKGLAVGLGVSDDRSVNSPTFVLVNEYEGRVPVRHIDAYRLTSAAELSALGFEEMIAEGAAIIVEWADRVPDGMPPSTLWIEFETPDDDSRILTIKTADAALASRLSPLGLTTP